MKGIDCYSLEHPTCRRLSSILDDYLLNVELHLNCTHGQYNVIKIKLTTKGGGRDGDMRSNTMATLSIASCDIAHHLDE